jgi:hypothetical protein
MMTIAGVSFTLKGIIFTAAAVQWLLVLLTAIFRRRSEIAVAASTIIFVSAWYGVLLRRPSAISVQQASTVARPNRSCEGIKPGTPEAEIKQKLGNPDHIRGEEETRGPAAEAWIYEDIRCVVHLYGDRVDSIE